MKHVLQPKSPLLSPFTSTIIHCECKLKGPLTPSESEHFYRPQRSWGKVMFLHVSVILFTGGSAPLHAGIYTPPPNRGRHPSQTRHPPGTRHPPQHSACWEIRATSGRYASYWNAILSLMFLSDFLSLSLSVNFLRDRQ